MSGNTPELDIGNRTNGSDNGVNTKDNLQTYLMRKRYQADDVGVVLNS